MTLRGIAALLMSLEVERGTMRGEGTAIRVVKSIFGTEECFLVRVPREKLIGRSVHWIE